MKEIAGIVVHHSASNLRATIDDIRRWHKARGFDDVGYHYVISATGAVSIGRRIPTTGAHIKGMNSTSIGICVVGDNTKRENEWTSMQHDALRALVRCLLTVWPGIGVMGHRDLADTLCPGLDVKVLLGTGRIK